METRLGHFLHKGPPALLSINLFVVGLARKEKMGEWMPNVAFSTSGTFQIYG